MEMDSTLANLIQQRAVSHVAMLLRTIRLRKVNRVDRLGRHFARGFDYYESYELKNVLQASILSFFAHRGYFPKHPLYCQSLVEKIFWSKFLVPLPLPTPADKLRRGDFIPTSLKGDILLPSVIWESDRANLPIFRPGRTDGYYYKANNGCRTLKRITLPSSVDERDELNKLGKSWLGMPPYNFGQGEWWYATIPPKLFLEEEVVNKLDDPMECRFTTIGGQIAYISINSTRLVGRPGSQGISIYTEDFVHLAHVRSARRPNLAISKPPDLELMSRAARSIGNAFEFARVDFYNPALGEVYLGEITLVPSSGNGSYAPRTFEYETGATWNMGMYVEEALS